METERFVSAFINHRIIKEKLHDASNELAKQNDLVLANRLAERTVLQKALAAFDQETRRLQSKADEETGLQKKVDCLNKELEKASEELGKSKEALESGPVFTYTNDDVGIQITRTMEERSGGTSLKSISAALCKAKLFNSQQEAEQCIKKHNRVEISVLKIRDTKEGVNLDISKEVPNSAKRQRK